ILDKIAEVASTRSTISGGLFDGAGSFLLIPIFNGDKYKEENIIKLINLYLIKEGENVRYPGQFSYRLSDDVYSGSSGIILAITALENNNPLGILPLIHSKQILKGIENK
ncbi:hypothetical protein BU032_13375, partial [Staphylococcus simulans]